MRLSCAICLELYTASADVSVGTCGHLFHTECLSTWITTNKSSCPSCRKSFPEKQIRRIYFSETDAPSEDSSQSDSNGLYNKIDSLSFNLRLCETEKKKACEELDKAVAKNIALREEFRALEARLTSARDDLSIANNKIRSLKTQKGRLEEVEKDLAKTKRQLQMYETIRLAVKGSEEELMMELHKSGDYSQAAREHHSIVMALKKELVKKDQYVTELGKQLTQKSRKIQELKSDLELKSREIDLLSKSNQTLSKDVKHMEEELEMTRDKLKKLQEAMTSPSGDLKSSAINRLLHEFPAPMHLTPNEKAKTTPPERKKKNLFDMSDESGDEDGRPLKRVKTVSSPCKENRIETSKLIKAASTNGVGLTALLGNISSHDFKCQPKKPGFSQELTYNGLGGHSKSDNFPQPMKRDAFKITKKPKGVSRPAGSSSLKASSSGSSQKIDKFFSLDTP